MLQNLSKSYLVAKIEPPISGHVYYLFIYLFIANQKRKCLQQDP